MGRFVFKLPDVGEGVAESEIAAWRVAVGTTVQEDEPLVDMLTDKAAVEIPSPVAGVVLECRGQVGDRIPVGAELVIIETAEADVRRMTSTQEPEPSPSVAPPQAGNLAASPETESSAVSPMASPALRRRARELGIDLHAVVGNGPRGRITQADLEAHLATRLPSPTPASASNNASAEDRVTEVRVLGLRRKIAESMQRSSQRIPHFAYVEETDVTELEALRAHLNADPRPDRTRLTLLPFLIRALIQVLPNFPQINATYDDEAGVVRRHSAVHMGVATQTSNGLTVPVVRHAERLDIWQCAAEIKRLASSVRENKAKREELSGSTITITSLGPIGGIASTPIINAPEVAIIGVNRIVERPAFRHGVVVPRLTMNLSSSFDHRIVDGWDAAEFIQKLRAMIEHPAALFMP